jgi:hypothetical protein
MRVRVWISGSDGPSHDFELLHPPRIGERITIAVGTESAEGVVTSVAWQLQGIERTDGDLSLEGEPAGSVTLVHVICDPRTEAFRLAGAGAEVDVPQATH